MPILSFIKPQISITIVISVIVLFIIWKFYTIIHENKKITLNVQAIETRNHTRKELFSPTQTVTQLKLDDRHQLFKFDGQLEIFAYDELIRFQVNVNNKPLDLSSCESISGQLILDEFDHVQKIEHLDLVFYTIGLNEGKYNHQMLYHPLLTSSEDYITAVYELDKLIMALYQILNRCDSISDIKI